MMRTEVETGATESSAHDTSENLFLPVSEYVQEPKSHQLPSVLSLKALARKRRPVGR